MSSIKKHLWDKIGLSDTSSTFSSYSVIWENSLIFLPFSWPCALFQTLYFCLLLTSSHCIYPTNLCYIGSFQLFTYPYICSLFSWISNCSVPFLFASWNSPILISLLILFLHLFFSLSLHLLYIFRILLSSRYLLYFNIKVVEMKMMMTSRTLPST